jgi:hypothetical protein
VLLAAGLDGVASTMRLALGRGEPVLVKRARLALGAVGGLAILSCLTPVALNLLPDDHDDAADVLIDVADNVVESAMGGEVDPRFVGGYSEYDLRGSVGVLQQEAPGTDASLRYATFEMRITNGAVATIVVGVDPDGGLVFLGGGPTVDVYPNRGSLRLASEPLADLAEDIATGLSSLTCLPGSAPPDLPGLVDTRSTLAPLCSGGSGSADDSRRRIDELAGSNHADGDTGTYRVWVQTGDVVHVLTGRLYSDLGRLWIGRATVESNP